MTASDTSERGLERLICTPQPQAASFSVYVLCGLPAEVQA